MTAASEIVHIPLNKLVASAFNVRKTGGQSLEELSASIRAHGLLHNLVVAKQAGSGKNGSQTFQVIAGGRRYAALVKLAKDKAIPKTFPVPCRVVESVDVTETSLAENVVREAMHPADQFEAFRALVDRGAGIEEIAARFGVTPAVVRQRLRLANVSPTLFALYRAGGITLEQLMALAITDDHAAQERVWNSAPPASAWRQPQALRAALTESKVDAATDSRIRFVGIEAYTAAGGHIERDLFQPEHEGYLTDPALLDRLVTEKLEALDNAVRAEGWKWVEIHSRFDASQLAAFGRLYPVATVLAPEVNAQIEALEAEREQIREGYSSTDDYPQAVKTRLSEIENRIDQLSGRKEGYSPETKASAGAIVALRNGEPFVYRGLVRTEDKRIAEVAKSDPQAEDNNDAGGGSQAGLPAALVEELTAHRTAALRATLAGRPDVALLAVTHRLALELCYDGPADGVPSALTIGCAKGPDRLDRHAKGIEESPAGIALGEQYARWRSRLPEAPEGLWGWLVAQNQSVILELLAFCAAQTVDAVRLSRGSDRARLAAADRLAQAVDLDMANWWKPASTGFLGRLSKDQILAVLTEATGTTDLAELKKLRKKDLLCEAERRLASARWLPEPLRSSHP